MGLARHARQLPFVAVSLGLEAWERSRGIRGFALRRGNEALQIVSSTPLGRLLPQQVLNDGADEEAARIAADARDGGSAPARPTAVQTQQQEQEPQQEQPQQHEAPKEPSEAAKQVGAPGAVTAEVEEIAESLHVAAPEDRSELPIPDFDNISLGSLRARLRSLSVEQLVVLREWEQAHAHRLPVLTTLDNRIAKVGGSGTRNGTGNGTGNATATSTATSTGTGGAYPEEAKAAERAAEDEGGTLRV